jgi:sugar/nucleoside kinase (ribokinase family)
MSDYEILIPGNYFCDLIFTGIPNFPSLGSEIYTQKLAVTVGGVLNTVIALQRLGVQVGWLGQVGTDLFSRFVLETVQNEGVDSALLTRLETAFQRVTVALSYPHDRAFITYVDSAPTSVQLVLDAPDSLRFRHLHFTGFQLDPRTLELLDKMQARGISVSMDCQDRPITLETPHVRDTISKLNIFMPNAKEAMQLTACESVLAAAEVLRPLVPVLVIKDGANGAYAWQGEQVWHEAALAVTPVDTTGAGDVFNAGFLMGYLKGDALTDCLRYGNVCGGLSTLGHGGADSAPSLEQVTDFLSQRKTP